ncbi:MAG: helix-turn-helix domain-containing protein [Marinilabiliaceae bacterium]|nr:helix-turn-helix domain-containing protein [Marinilabiliaceae bacterium]
MKSGKFQYDRISYESSRLGRGLLVLITYKGVYQSLNRMIGLKQFYAFFMIVLKNIHIGKIIKQKLEDSPMNITEFAKKIHLDRTTVYDIFERKSIDTELLIKISQILNYDFYNETYHKTPTNNLPQKFQITLEIDKKNIKILNLPDGMCVKQ